jgi:integrase
MPKLTKTLIDGFNPATEEFLWDSDVKGFGVRAKPSGVKSFVLKYRMGATTRRTTICKVGSPYTVTEARSKAAEMLKDVREGIDPTDVKAEARKAVTVGELADLYLANGPAAKPNKKDASWRNDRSVITRHIKPLLGRKMAAQLTRPDVTRFQADVANGKTAVIERTKARGKAVVTGGKTAARLATVTLRALFQFGVDTGRVPSNPASGVELYKTERRERFLSEAEVAFIADALAELEDEAQVSTTMADAIRLLMVTGARREEVLTLRWDWVDFDRSALRLPDSKTGQKVVPLASAALAILSGRERGESPHVFPAARGEGATVGVPKAWGRVKVRATALAQAEAMKAGRPAAAAPDFATLRLHDLRHSFASFAVADGASLFMVGKVLGHKQARTTEIYAHLRDDPLQQVAEQAGRRIADAMRPRGTRGSGEVIALRPG